LTNSPVLSASRLPLYVVSLLLIIVTAIFVLELVTTTQSDQTATLESTPELTASTYMEQVTALLENADQAQGAVLVEQYGCVACHRLAANKIAPPFVGIADRAATRRPPLTAAAYIYESITNPTAYVVEGFSPAMPQNFRDRLSDRELGDIMAYLLTPDAQ
jgi:cytochrome c551/c552